MRPRYGTWLHDSLASMVIDERAMVQPRNEALNRKIEVPDGTISREMSWIIDQSLEHVLDNFEEAEIVAQARLV